jgi:hypothetical protein
MGCCVEGDLTRETAREACRTVVHEAVEEALSGDVFGVLVDALPTLGKSRTVARITRSLVRDSGKPQPVTVLTHRKETRDQLEAWADEAALNPHQLPRFDDDCPTARGEFGDDWADRVADERQRGISPSELHATGRLPCTDDGTCPYVAGWEECREHTVLVGHPSHAYVDEVVRDRVVVFDEDPGEAFRTDFDSNAVHEYVAEYLSETDEFDDLLGDDSPALTSVDDLVGLRKFRPEQSEELLEPLLSEPAFGDSSLVGRKRGHGDTRAVILTLLRADREDLGNSVERVELPDEAVALYDSEEGSVIVRRPPDLSKAAAVVGLDGTPVLRVWEGRLGCPSDGELQYERVLCDECRPDYLFDVLGYRVHQTTPHVKPYSSGEYVSVEKDLALVEAVYRETGERPAVITTKKAKKAMKGKMGHAQATAHYGAIRGSNVFEGDEVSVGIVLGSPHPGDREIIHLAGLNGDRIETPGPRADRGKNLSYGVAPRQNEPRNPYLAHYREHRVVQAILRFGRQVGALVYVHTGAVPEWILTDGAINTEQSVFRRERGGGEREVVGALADGGDLTVAQLVDRVGIRERTVYERLADLSEDGMAEKLPGKQPHRWRLLSHDSPRVGQLVGDRWYILLPGVTEASR